MSKFVNYIGILFAHYAPVEGWEGIDRRGMMTVDGFEVVGVTVNEDRTVTMRLTSNYFNVVTFEREALRHGEVTFDSESGASLWRVTPTIPNWHGDPSTIRFFKDATMEASEAIKNELYDYD